MADNRFAPWLKRQLARREWTAADFARKLHSSEGTVSHWLRGERIPRPTSCEQIADVLGVEVDLVLYMAGHRPLTEELDPDDPATRIIALVKQIQWNEDRAETIIAILERMRKFDRQRAGE